MLQTLILDSSQISAWYECPTMWANRGLVAIETPGKKPKIEYPEAGTLMHKFLEIYYTTLAVTGDRGPAAKKALAFDENAPTEEHFPKDPELRTAVRKRFGEYLMFYGKDYTPASKKKHVIGTKNGVLADFLVPDPLIEKGFSYKVFESPEYLFILEGRIDFMGSVSDGTFFWMDHKLQFKESILHPKSIQFRNYSLATGLHLAVINYIRLHQKIQENTFVRQSLSFSALELRHWKQELIDEVYIPCAKQVMEQKFPKHRSHCKFCQFPPLCDEYNPNTRALIQVRDFQPKKEWRPW